MCPLWKGYKPRDHFGRIQCHVCRSSCLPVCRRLVTFSILIICWGNWWHLLSSLIVSAAFDWARAQVIADWALGLGLCRKPALGERAARQRVPDSTTWGLSSWQPLLLAPASHSFWVAQPAMAMAVEEYS